MHTALHISHRFRGGVEPETREAKILFDADKMDMVGAVGVARSFIMAGQYGQRIYSDAPMDEYVRKNIVDGVPGGRIKEISRHVPSRIQTEEAKEIIRERPSFMEVFFERLRKEISGEL